MFVFPAEEAVVIVKAAFTNVPEPVVMVTMAAPSFTVAIETVKQVIAIIVEAVKAVFVK
jgi:hypothetical protein